MPFELFEGVDRGFSQRLSFCVFGGLITLFWFSHLENAYLLGAIIAFAMIINLVVAGVSGVALPILLEKMKVDPAVASGVFVTTITDVVGFRILGLGIDFFTLMAKERRGFRYRFNRLHRYSCG